MLAKSRKILNKQVPQSMAGLRVQFSSQVLNKKSKSIANLLIMCYNKYINQKRKLIRSHIEPSNQYLQLVDHQNDFGSFSFQLESSSSGNLMGCSQVVRQRTLIPWSLVRYQPSQFLDSLAQLVEHLTFNQRVTGSSPVRVIQQPLGKPNNFCKHKRLWMVWNWFWRFETVSIDVFN